MFSASDATGVSLCRTARHPGVQQLVERDFNRFLATLPPHDFSVLALHLRTSRLERGVMLHDVGEKIEYVYFPHNGMG
jgi:hypothetical protein